MFGIRPIRRRCVVGPSVVVVAFVCGLVPACTHKSGEPPLTPLRTTNLPIHAEHMVRRPADGYLVLSGARPVPSDDTVAALAVVSGDGEESWTRTYPELAADRFVWADVTSDGGLVAVGSSAPWADPASDITLVRCDGQGNVIWERSYGGPSGEHPGSVIETRDGGLLVAGVTASSGAGATDALVLRLSADGDVRWTRTFGGTGYEGEYEDGSRAFETRDGRFILVGSTDSASLKPAGASVAVYLVRIDGDGSKLWERTYGMRGGYDVGSDVRELKDGGFVVSGTRSNAADGLYVIRTDADGAIIWQTTIETGDTHAFVAIEPIDDGFIVGNRSFEYSDHQTLAYVAKLDLDGWVQWETRFGAEEFHRVLRILPDAAGGHIALCAGPEWTTYLATLGRKRSGDVAD